MPRVSLESVTVAPGMTAPCASLTVPVRVPVVTWAAAGNAIIAMATIATTSRTNLVPLLMWMLLPRDA